jgi:hypothetical protein
MKLWLMKLWLMKLRLKRCHASGVGQSDHQDAARPRQAIRHRAHPFEYMPRALEQAWKEQSWDIDPGRERPRHRAPMKLPEPTACARTRFGTLAAPGSTSATAPRALPSKHCDGQAMRKSEPEMKSFRPL